MKKYLSVLRRLQNTMLCHPEQSEGSRFMRFFPFPFTLFSVRVRMTGISVILLSFLISCGGGGGGGGSPSTQGKLSFVQITLGGSEKPDVNSSGEVTGFRENSIPSNIYKFSFTVSASDMATVQKDVLVSGQTAVTETFSIQNGSGRYFLIEAKDSSGTVLYKGDSTKDLDGTPVTLNIVMVAQNTGGTTTTTTTTNTTTTTTTTTTTPTTTTTSDTTAPTITGVSPADSATGVSITSTITATFSESMDSTTITTSTFTVSGGVSGTVTYSGTTATFTPSSSLSYSTTYTATITTGVKDSAGNTMASNYTWSWTTGSTPDTTAPTVTSKSPASGATGVSISTTITATFSEAMDSSTITTSTFTVSGVTGTVTYSGTTATFTPSSSLSYSTTYTSTITTGVKDSAGNTMASNYSWSFTTGSAISLPKTGQTTVYSTDDDGTLQKGVAWPSTRFTVGTGAEASCITDNLTGLMWVQSPDSTTRTWANALTYANDLSLCGYTDWRLPNINELESLINAEQSNTAAWLNTQGFSNVQSANYWSSTTHAYGTGSAWYVYMNYSNVYYATKTTINYVLPVRAGQGEYASTISLPKTGQTTVYSTDDDGTLQKGVALPSPRFTVGTGAEASCITDNLTGLMWVQSPDNTTRTWENALTYANGLSLCGYTDWRLPNRKELRSLINYGQSNTATWLNTQGFSNVQAGSYWSSTTFAVNTGVAFCIYMDYEYVGGPNKTSIIYVLPVRAGQ